MTYGHVKNIIYFLYNTSITFGIKPYGQIVVLRYYKLY